MRFLLFFFLCARRCSWGSDNSGHASFFFFIGNFCLALSLVGREVLRSFFAYMRVAGFITVLPFGSGMLMGISSFGVARVGYVCIIHGVNTWLVSLRFVLRFDACDCLVDWSVGRRVEICLHDRQGMKLAARLW